MINILLVEDNPGDARLVEEALRQAADGAFYLRHVTRVHEAMDYLKSHPLVDVILSDMSLPDSRDTETFQLLHQAAADVPVIFMTGSHDTKLALEAIQQGAQDYLIKGEFSSHSLVRVIKYAIERKKYQGEVTAARAKAKALRQTARLLKREQTQLVALNKAKDEFISLASHQLRTPATGVKQYLGMVLEGYAGEVPAELQAFVKNAYDSNERQLSIVNDLLNIAQLDAGKVVLSLQPTNLAELLANIIHEQAAKYAARRQRLIFDPEDRTITLTVDPDKMRMVFENLIDNASKYTPEGKNVHVSLSANGGEVTVVVRDEGVGVAAEDVEKMFHKFSRVANARSDLVGGSGLGLYWAKRIVDLHNGSITVRSIVGEGTSFVVKLSAVTQSK